MGEVTFVFWVKNRDCECVELQKAEGKELHGSAHGPYERGVCVTSSAHRSAARAMQERNSQHGSSTRGVSVRRATFIFRTWGSNTDRVRWLASHGSPARGVSVRRAEHNFRTRGVLSNTDHVHILACTGLRGFARGAFLGSARGVQIGMGHAGSARVKLSFARVVQFSLLLR